ncbi:MAG: VOC family protein [Acidobacteriota bacterium]|jgi:methylmalonyl-CoA/ethylmalonyl-CoA epimerase
MNGLRFHHVGLVVHDIASAAEELRSLGYVRCSERFVDERQGIDIVLCDGPATVWACVELIQPHRRDSAVSALLAKNGATPYHLCFEVDLLPDALDALRERGYAVVVEPFESPVFEGRPACFAYHKHLGLIELVERAAPEPRGT